jgi:hypothetical protein
MGEEQKLAYRGARRTRKKKSVVGDNWAVLAADIRKIEQVARTKHNRIRHPRRKIGQVAATKQSRSRKSDLWKKRTERIVKRNCNWTVGNNWISHPRAQTCHVRQQEACLTAGDREIEHNHARVRRKKLTRGYKGSKSEFGTRKAKRIQRKRRREGRTNLGEMFELVVWVSKWR